jgi:Cytochrome P460
MRGRRLAVSIAGILGLVSAVAGNTAFDDPPARFTNTLIRFDRRWQAAAQQMSLVRAAPLAQPSHGGSARPRYTNGGELEVPKGFRSWVFVGADLSPTYKPDQPEPTRREQDSHEAKPAGAFHNIYINRESYDAYLEDGRFPDPTVLVMELFQAESKDAKGILKSGEFEGKRIALEAAVKDSNRPGGGVPWAYYAFDLDANGKPAKSAKAFPDRSCYDCHLKHASKDNVWVQFYPALRDPADR